MTFSISDFNFILQIAIFGFLLIGIFYMKKGVKNLKKHRLFMFIVVSLNAISILLVMGRSFFDSAGHLVEEFYELIPMITLTHGLTGGFAEILGISFLFKHPPKTRSWMKITAILWTIVFLLGIYIYYLHSLDLHPH
jgi:uncharacterized membrane protein YozB (DUF420 family)